MKIRGYKFILLFIIFGLLSCQKEDLPQPENETEDNKMVDMGIEADETNEENKPNVYDLILTNETVVGKINITHDSLYIYVSYNLKDDWTLRNMDLFLGDLEKLPLNDMDHPVPPKYPYRKRLTEVSQESYVFSIKRDSFSSDCLSVVAQAQVQKSFDNGDFQSGRALIYGTLINPNLDFGWYNDFCLD